VADVGPLETFIAGYTTDGTLLPRSRPNLLHHIRDFRVVRDRGTIIGCGALQLVGGDLAEVRSVAVHPGWQRQGLGGRIVRALLGDARRLGVRRVFCLTRREEFFARLGFAVVPKETFPHKIWNDCRMCPRQECCDEIAMQHVLRSAARLVAASRTTRTGRRA
jgi:amino-acid N-acetyltransferase